MKYDFVVVGAGVSGLYTSLLLAKKGYKVALFESKPREKIGEKTCGDAIGIHHFQHLGIDVPSSVIDHRYDGVKIYSPSEKHEIIVPGEGVSVNRVLFGQWLLKNAQDAGVELFDQSTILGLELKNSYVSSVIAKKTGGEKIVVEARGFVDASGSRPALRSKLPPDWPIAERPYTTDFNIAYREVLALDTPVKEEDKRYAVIYINTEIAPGGYWWLFPKSMDGTVANIGLGVVWNGKYNPRHQYVKYLEPRFPGKILHEGGGIVPTRRPLPTLVWRNVAVVGDAAYTVNPVHGGGIGSSLEASSIVAKYMSKAAEEGEINEVKTWGANMEYMKVYGAKQAGLDILRMYMQMLTNEEYEWIIKSRIVDGESVYDLGVRGELGEKVVQAVYSFLKLVSKPRLLQELRVVKQYATRNMRLHLEDYPQSPDAIFAWMRRVEELYEEYIARLGYERGEHVKW